MKHNNNNSNSNNNNKSPLLPLMQANDRFITSAILTGLINRVIWVQPDWLTIEKPVEYFKGIIGKVINEDESNGEKLCGCERKRRQTLTDPNQYCYYFTDDAQTQISRKHCKTLKIFKLILISETVFLKAFNSKSLKENHVILDIDEDYFGVQSGVQVLIDAGIPLDVVNVIDEVLLQLFCPDSIMAEQALDKALRMMFGSLHKSFLLNTTKSAVAIKSVVSEHAGKHFCKKEGNKEILGEEILVEFISYLMANVTSKIAGALSNTKYCFYDSLQLNHETQNKLPEFYLCHGTIYPAHKLNQIYVDTETGIKKRGERLSKMLDHIFESVTPKIITISRSLRDGYVPRKQQRLIEHTVRQAIETNLSKRFIRSETIFDENLVGGKEGWK